MELFCLYSLVSLVLVVKSEHIGESVVPFYSTLPVLSCNSFMLQ